MSTLVVIGYTVELCMRSLGVIVTNPGLSGPSWLWPLDGPGWLMLFASGKFNIIFVLDIIGRAYLVVQLARAFHMYPTMQFGPRGCPHATRKRNRPCLFRSPYANAQCQKVEKQVQYIQYASKKRFQNRSVSFGETVINVPFVCRFRQSCRSVSFRFVPF